MEIESWVTRAQPPEGVVIDKVLFDSWELDALEAASL
jgi:hypothetical protein